MHRRTAAASAGVRRADADARPPRARGAIVDRARVAPLAAALVAALALALVALVVVASSSSWASSSSSPPPPPRGDPRARVASSTRATDDVELEPTTAAAATTTTTPATRLVTPDELATRNGVDDPSLWLAIVGRVFDVTRGGGARHYARGMPYAGFVGRDGTRAFATGRFDEDGLVPDVDGLSDDEILGVRRWLEFYEGGSEERDAYREIGVLAGGHYYDANGVETRRKLAFDAAANRAEGRARDDSAREALWRTCARKTRSDGRAEVWCEDGASHPREERTREPARAPGGTGRTRMRCACFPDASHGATRALYEGCDAEATRCVFDARGARAR